MTPAGFRRLALSMFAAVEGSHMGHADFRVGGKVFASLPPSRKNEPRTRLGMVRLPADLQARLVRNRPDVFTPAAGAWGRQGCTYVRLGKVDSPTLRTAVAAAWRNVAPTRMLADLDELARETAGPTARRAGRKPKPA